MNLEYATPNMNMRLNDSSKKTSRQKHSQSLYSSFSKNTLLESNERITLSETNDYKNSTKSSKSDGRYVFMYLINHKCYDI